VKAMQNEETNPKGKNEDSELSKKGLLIGVSFGIAIGAGIGAAIDNVALGIGIGLAIGTPTGFIIYYSIMKKKSK
jgi:F0F1-type ATP synthase assembly protein I